MPFDMYYYITINKADLSLLSISSKGVRPGHVMSGEKRALLVFVVAGRSAELIAAPQIPADNFCWSSLV